jgi:DMSO/TMAO reductase YedYZ molybdopterin-dependent catalytic subunit
MRGVESISVSGAVSEPVDVPFSDLASMRRRELTADFHCVAGWTAQHLKWSGVPFHAFYEEIVQSIALPGVTHVRLVGADGFRSVLPLADALEDGVTLADELDAQPLTRVQGGPVRLVCPSRYGYKSTKHLAAIELHTTEPRDDHLNGLINAGVRLVKAHPRGRVDLEERHRYLPSWAVRGFYFRVLHPAFRFLCAIGERRSRT